MRIGLPLLAFISILFCTSAEAQNWKWAKSITSPGISSSVNVGGTLWNSDLTTDPAGNVYFLTKGDAAFQVDGRTVSGHGGKDIIVSSFTCDGVYRWSKIIGTPSDSDLAFSIKADAAGGIYMLAEMHLSSSHNIDTDTSIGSTSRTMYLVKWDTTGKYQWLRMPQSASTGYVEASVESQLIDMDVDAQGNTHVLAYLSPGIYGASYNVSVKGMHVLRYDANGNFLGGNSMPITLSTGNTLSLFFNWRMTYVPAENRYLIKGYCAVGGNPLFGLGTATIGGTTVPQRCFFVTSIHAGTGAVSWLKYPSNVLLALSGRPQVDADHNVYVSGRADSAATLGVPTFNGVTLNPGPFAMKLNGATGNPMWTVSGRVSNKSSSLGAAIGGSAAFSLGIANGRVVLGGQFKDTLTFPTQKLTSNFLTDSSELFLLQLDASSGAIQQSVKLSGGDGPAITHVAPGKKNNFYVFGNIGSRPITFGASTVQTPPSYNGCFIAKWGFNNCNCSLPSPNFTSSTVSGTTVRYTYTGTTGGIDSLVWEWGDGVRQKVTTGFTTPITHTYASKGKYNVCVTAYNDTCGENRYCGQTALAVKTQVGIDGIHIYPNPAVNRLFIEGAKGASLEIFSIVGQLELNTDILDGRQLVDVSGLSAGTYLLRLTMPDGNSGTTRFVKQ